VGNAVLAQDWETTKAEQAKQLAEKIVRNAVLAQDWEKARKGLEQGDRGSGMFSTLIRGFNGTDTGGLRLTDPLDVLKLVDIAPKKLQHADGLGQVFRHGLGRSTDAVEQKRWKQLLLAHFRDTPPGENRDVGVALLIGADLLEEALQLLPELRTSKATVPAQILEQFSARLVARAIPTTTRRRRPMRMDARPPSFPDDWDNRDPTTGDAGAWDTAWRFQQEILDTPGLAKEHRISALDRSLQLIHHVADETTGKHRLQALVRRHPQGRERILERWLDMVNAVPSETPPNALATRLRGMFPPELAGGQHTPENDLRLPMALAQLDLESNQPDHAVGLIKEITSRGYPDKAAQLADQLLLAWTSRRRASDAGGRRALLAQFKAFVDQFPPRLLSERYLTYSFERLVTPAMARAVRALGPQQMREWEPPDPPTVYAVEDIEAAFGAIASVDAKLLQQVAANIEGQWARAGGDERVYQGMSGPGVVPPGVARKYKVLTAFFALDQLLEQICARKPNWRVLQVHARLLATCHASFGNQPDVVEGALKASSKGGRRGAAVMADVQQRLFAKLRLAAQSYRAECQADVTPEVQDQLYLDWFNAAIGDLTHPTPTPAKHVPAKPFQEIRAALEDLPAGVRVRCVERLATELERRLPAAQHRYTFVKWALAVANTPELHRRFEYYEKLRGRVRFRARLDGDPRVGANRPFGVFLAVLQTAESYQELGAFETPVGSANIFQANYLEQGELNGNFFVVDVKFHDWPLQARPGEGADQGWFVYPLGYVVLKAKDTAPREIAPLQFDVSLPDFRVGAAGSPQFSDRRQNLVTLPLTSDTVPIHAGEFSPRPVSNPRLRQTLVRALNGDLSLKVKATGHGVLAEDVGAWFDLDQLPGLRGQPGLSRSTFAALNAVSGRPDAECVWTLPLDRSRALRQGQFNFPAIKASGVDPGEWYWQPKLKPDRLDEPQVVVEDPRSHLWLWGSVLLAAVALGACVWGVRRFARRRSPETSDSEPAGAVDSFRLIGWLRQLESPPWEVIARLENSFLGVAVPPVTQEELRQIYRRYAGTLRDGIRA
jgi:hypothetical protein